MSDINNKKVLPVGLYTHKQRFQVFLFVLIVGVIIVGAFRVAMLFFYSYSAYSDYVAVSAFGLFLLSSLIALIAKNLDRWFRKVLVYIMPALFVFLLSLALFVVLIENGIMNINGILGWFD